MEGTPGLFLTVTSAVLLLRPLLVTRLAQIDSEAAGPGERRAYQRLPEPPGALR